MSNWLTNAFKLIIAVALPLVLLLGNIQLLANMRFVRYEYGRAGFPPDIDVPPDGYSLSRAERTALAEAAMQSIIGPQGMQALEEARFQETGAPAFNAREIGHMSDVRWLFQRARVVFWVALLALISGVVWLVRGKGGWRAAARPLLNSVVVTLSVALALGLYIWLNFDNFFTQFHHAFFEGDTWRFKIDDTLIRLFPTDFWFDAAIIIAGLTVVELLVVGAGAWWWGRKKRTRIIADEHG